MLKSAPRKFGCSPRLRSLFYIERPSSTRMTFTLVTFLLSWSLLISWSAAADTPPTVHIGNSSFVGLQTQVEGKTVWKFLGIRFAQAPTGSFRFKKPQAASLPTGAVNATYFRAACPATIEFDPAPVEDEDCLFLNVYVPKSSGSTSLPVMVWIYGGGFNGGNSRTYLGDVLAARGDVIVITLNYRLGPFGFLSTGDSASVGNYGLWDQQLALKWVKDNIRHFGGDDTKITLFGESAGGASVSYHTISPHSSSLFLGAILQSGTYLAPWATTWGPPLAHATSLARALSCSTENTQSMVECLRNKNATEIVRACKNLFFENNLARDLLDMRWLPVPDGDFVPAQDKITKFPGPIMVGINNNEGAYFIYEVMGLAEHYPHLYTELYTRDFYLGQFLPNLIQMVYRDLAANLSSQPVKNAAKLLECTYEPTKPSSNANVTQQVLDQVYGDHEFFVGAIQFLLGEPSTNKTYMYVFDHYPSAQGGNEGMAHAADIPFTFGFNRDYQFLGFPLNVSQVDLTLSADFQKVLTNFAKTGIPNQPVLLPTAWPAAWPPYTKGEKSYLALSPSSKVASRFREDKMAVWLSAVPALLRSEPLDNDQWNACLGRPTSGSIRNFDLSRVLTAVFVALAFCLM